LEIISCFWVKKTLFWRVLGSKTGVSEHSEFTEILEIVLFQNSRKQKVWKILSFAGP